MLTVRPRSPFWAVWVGSLAAGSAGAQDSPPVRLTFDIGFVNAAGNTSVTTLSAGENLEFRPADSRWRFQEALAVVYGRTSDSTTAEQVKVTGRVDYDVVGPVHVFVGATFERNRFAGIAHRFEEVVGMALRPLETPRDLLIVELGSALTQQRSTAPRSSSFVAGRVAASYKHQFSSSVYAQQSIETLPNLEASDDWRLNSETVLVAPLSSKVAIKLAYLLRYDNVPEPGFRKADRVFTSALQLAF